MKIIIVGSHGLLGNACCRLWSQTDEIIPLDLPDFDATHRMFVLDTILPVQPDVIVNAAGIGMIDWLELRPNTARTVHTHLTANLREAAKRTEALLVQISCSEIFGGSANLSHSENDVPQPESVFALTKLDAERAAAEWEKHLIVRCSHLFGQKGARSGGNFVEAILSGLRHTRNFKVISDIRFSPSWTDHIAKAIYSLIQSTERNSKIYHVSNQGIASHLEIADEIRRITGLRFNTEPITHAEYGTNAPRCLNNALDASLYHTVPNVCTLPDWRCALEEYLQSRQI